MNEASVASILARAAAATTYDSVPAPTRKRARLVFLDTLAVIAAGGTAPRIRSMTDAGWLGDGPCTAISSGKTMSPVGAAVANACCGNVALLGEGSSSGGHPAIHLVPSVLAASEYLNAAGPACVTALLVGYEITARLGRAAHGKYPGTHSNASRNTVGVAAAVAHLASGGDMRIVEAAMETAAGIATIGPWAFATQGVDAYHLVPGMGAGQGVLAGATAALGWTGGTGILEDFFGPRAGRMFVASGCYEELTDDGSWSEYLINGNYFKKYPTCAYTISSIDAVANLIETEGITDLNVAEIDVSIAEGDSDDLWEQDPPNLFAARYSIPVLVAVAIVYGSDAVISLDEKAIADPRVRRISKVTSARLDPALRASHPRSRPAIVRVRKTDGRLVECLVEAPSGEPDNPLSDEELRSKQLTLLSTRYRPETAASILATTEGWLTGNAPLADVSGLLRKAGNSGA